MDRQCLAGWLVWAKAFFGVALQDGRFPAPTGKWMHEYERSDHEDAALPAEHNQGGHKRA